jgi:tetratricopeptide (TPR) repeat protein
MSKQRSAPKNQPHKPADTRKQPAKTRESASEGKKQWIVFILLAVLTYVTFFPSLKGEFTNWDDGTYVTENPMIWKLDGKAIKEIFTTPVSLNYHPLTMLTLALDYKLGKLDPFYYHFNNILLHICNSILVFIFMRMFISGLNRKKLMDFRPDPFNVALIVAVLFAIHPMRVESVTWIAERKDVLYVFFLLLSAIFYLKWKDNRKLTGATWVFVFFVCSCLSKGMGVVLPAVLVLIDWLYGETKTVKQLFQSIVQKAHLFIAALVFGVVAFKIQSQGAIAAMETFSLFQRLTFGCYGFVMYIYKLFVPINLSAFYPYPFTDAQGNIPTIYYASPFIVLSLVVAILILLRKTEFNGKVLAFGFSFYFITIALVLQFLSVGSVIMADRYAYLSYVGLFFMIAYFYEYVRKKYAASFSQAFTGLLVVAAGIFSYLTHERTKVWTNAETLWTDAMNQYPFIEIAYENRGIYYKDHNELDKMLKDYEFVTQKLHSRNEKIWSNLGNLHGLRKEFDKSLEAYSKAIEYNPTNSSTYLNRAITFSMMGKYAQSLPDYDKAVELDPNTALIYKNRAYTLLQLGQFDKSVSDYDKALQLYSFDTLSYLNRGIAEFNAKKFEDAIKDFNTFSSMSPNNPQAYYNASMAYNNIGKFPEALENAMRAKKLGLNISEAYLKELQSKVK